MTILGRVLQEVLKEKGMSQSELATSINRSSGFIAHIVSGRREHIDAELSATISAKVGTPDDFWTRINADERKGAALSVAEYLLQLKPETAENALRSGVMVDHELKAMLCTEDVEFMPKDGKQIGIEGFDPSRLGAASYDTVIGGTWQVKNGSELASNAKGPISLAAGQHVKVYTKEFFVMPANIIGRIAPAWSFVQQGIVVAHGPLIDPCFRGQLTVMLHNFSGKNVEVDISSRFLTIVFERLAHLPDIREAPLPYGTLPPAKEQEEIRRQLAEHERQAAVLRSRLF